MKLFKPEPHKKVKARKKRQETNVKMTVRPQVVNRDGYCRLRSASRAFQKMFGVCRGVSEWAHWEQYKRARTRGKPPEERHTTRGSLMMCTGHHDDYDDGRLKIEATTDRECDGNLRFIKGEYIYTETGLCE